MDDEIFVQVKFTTTVDGSIYRDALWFSETDWATVTPQQIADMKQARVDNWLAMIAAASLVDIPPEDGGE